MQLRMTSSNGQKYYRFDDTTAVGNGLRYINGSSIENTDSDQSDHLL